MKLAFDQARINLGNTNVNPSVGCVIVKNNNVISSSSTSLNGRPHAEHNAINLSRFNVKNSNLFVTLEPCFHYGKTSPCINKIINCKIKKVYFSINDPDKKTYNKSFKKLIQKRIFVNKGLLKNDAINFYKSYIKFKNHELPFVTGKLAISNDYYTVNKKKRWITNSYSRGRVHLLRYYHDSIITSSETLLKDNPQLTCRIKGLEKGSPARIILDKNLKTPVNSKIVKDANSYKTIILFNKMNRRKIKILKDQKVNLFKIPLDNENNLDLVKSLKKIKEFGYSRVLLESGVKLIENFLKNDLIDEFKLFATKKNLKSNGMKSFKNNLLKYLNKKSKKVEKINLFNDRLITYKLK